MSTQKETFEIDDVRVLEVLNNAMRLRMLHHLMEPSSARELAEQLEVPVTRLYYHLDILEGVGVIQVVETRKRGALLQRIYQTTARSMSPIGGLIENSTDRESVIQVAVGVVLDGARADATVGLVDHFDRVDRGEAESKGAFGRTIAFLPEEKAKEFARRISVLAEEMAEAEDREGIGYAFSFVFFPMVGPVREDGI